MKWTVRIVYTVTTEFDVEADTKDEAQRLAYDVESLPEDLVRRVKQTRRHEADDYFIWPAAG